MAVVSSTSFETTDGTTTPVLNQVIQGTGDGIGWSGNWTGSSNFLYTNAIATPTGGGTWMATNGGASTGNMQRVFSSTYNVGTFSCYMRRSSNSSGQTSFIIESLDTNTQGLIRMNNSGNIVLIHNSGTAILQSYTVNQWYNVQFEFDMTVPKVRVSIDGGTPSAYFTPIGNTTSPMNKVYLDQPATGGGNSYWDVISLVNTAIPTITLSPLTLPNGSTGTAYSQTITASGGTAPYTFSVTSGSLPTGLSLSSGGVLSGTPTVAGPYSFTVTAMDTNGFGGSQAYSVTITAASTFATVSRGLF